MKTETINLPSGAIVTVKNLQIIDASKIGMGKRNASDSVTQIMTQSITEEIDRGPYNAGRGYEWWYIADRFVVTLWSRILTYGADYAFPFKCTECGERNEWEIDLSRDLSIRPIPKESIEKAMGNEGIPLPEWRGVTLTARLLTGKDEGTHESEHGALVDTIVNRIYSVDGARQKDAIIAFVGKQDLEVLDDLVAHLEKADGGADTKIDVVCSHCEERQTVQLPLGAKFYRSSRKKAR